MKTSFVTEGNYFWQNGIYYHRIHQPCQALKERGHGVQNIALGNDLSKNLLDYPDTVIFGRTYHPELKPLEVLRKFKSEGKRVLWDIDDDIWTVNPDNPSALVSNAFKDQYEGFAKEADAVITPSAVLAKKIKKLKKDQNVFICPNMVNPTVYAERPHAHKELIIGYMGAASHWRDMNLITDVVIDLQKKYDFAFVVYGLTGNPLESEMYAYNEIVRRGLEPEKTPYLQAALDWWGKAKNVKIYPHIPFHQPFFTPMMHPLNLSRMDLDIGLAPLEDNEFNHGKSNIKFYEYAAVGTVTLASDVTPYKEEVNYRAKNTYKDWYKKLERLIVDKEFREKTLKQQQEYVKNNRTTTAVGVDWEKAIQKPGGLDVLNQK